MSNIKPELPGGFRDYLSDDQIKRDSVINTIKRVFEQSGFRPLDTPAIEKTEVLTGSGSEFDKEIFEIERDEEKQGMALRFDLTVPLARVVSAYPQDLHKPFKRYQVGRVWRGEKPQAGRFREFLQIDADIVGSPRYLADAEIISLVYKAFDALGLDNFLIRINNRKILNGLPGLLGFEKDITADVLRALDKLDKKERSEVADELGELGLSEGQIQKLWDFVELKEESDTALLESLLEKDNVSMKEGAEELQEIVENLESLGVPGDAWTIDLSIARGLDYYTGPVFEAEILGSEVGSVCAGGRYDDLVERFSGSKIPAVGVSIGVDRLFAAVEKFTLPKSVSIPRVMVLNFDKSCEPDCVSIAENLRNEGVSTEIYLGQEETLTGQLSHATRTEVPVVLILGSQEKEKGVVQVKDMRAREQIEVSRDKLADKILDMLNSSS